MCDASVHAAGYVPLTEDCTDTADCPLKAYASIALGSRKFTAGQMSLTNCTKEFSTIQSDCDEFDHNLRGVKKPRSYWLTTRT